jgi:hypothetical protein
MKNDHAPEKECPECKGEISWKIVRNDYGAPFANGLCSNCNIVFRGREAPEIRQGMNLEKHGEVDGVPIKDMHCMDKRITKLSCDTQIGILRQRQHPKGNEVYSPYCKKCEGTRMQYEQKNGYKCSVCNSINR